MRGLAREPVDRQQSAQELGVAIARVAHATFGPDWLDDGEVRLLAPGAILDAATGRTRSPRQTPQDDDPPTRIVHRPSIETEVGDETRVVSSSGIASGSHEVEEEYDGVVFGDLERDPAPVDDTRGPSYPPRAPDKPPPTPPPPPPVKPWWRRWLTVGVMLLVVLVVVALLARACSSSADSGSSGSDSSGSSGTTATSATCWDGGSADSVASCSAPSGLDELAWMFPSIDDSCGPGRQAPDGLRQVVICPFEAAGDKGYIRYSNWHQRDDAINHYTKDFVADPGTWSLDGSDIGSLWVGDEPRPDVAYPFKAAGVYRDLPLSFSAYAHTRAGLQGALDEVITPRPPDQLRGVSDGSELASSNDALEHEAHVLANRIARDPLPRYGRVLRGGAAPRTGQGAGRALDAHVRAPFESALGRDLSRVRVHTDDSARATALDMGAAAYTLGADVFFAPGRFAPHTLAGSHLLAHELTHVVQHQELGLQSVIHRAPLPKEVETSPQHKALLSAIMTASWPRAASMLNAYNVEGIRSVFEELAPRQVESLFLGAVANDGVGAGSNVAKEAVAASPELQKAIDAVVATGISLKECVDYATMTRGDVMDRYGTVRYFRIRDRVRSLPGSTLVHLVMAEDTTVYLHRSGRVGTIRGRAVQACR